MNSYQIDKGCIGFDKGYSGFDKVWELNYFHSQMGFCNLFILVFMWVFWGLWGGSRQSSKAGI